MFGRYATKVVTISFKGPDVSPRTSNEAEHFIEMMKLVEVAQPYVIRLSAYIVKQFTDMGSQRQRLKNLITKPMHERLRSAYANLADKDSEFFHM